ncbi:MAG: guanylate kinase [Acidimicrobiales bacterium]
MIIVIFGAGGVGKGTLISRMLARDESLWLSRSWTTRARRPGEPTEAYWFVDKEAFEAKVAAGGFLEWASILGELYGTPLPDQPAGRDVVLEIDVQGARQIMASTPDALLVLITAPSVEVQVKRLRGRGDAEAHVQRRVALGRREEVEGRQIASRVVVNSDLDTTVDELLAIIGDARSGEAPRP